MKIALVIGWLKTGGAENFVADMAILLSKKYDVKVISLFPGRGVPYEKIKNNNKIEIIEMNRSKKIDLKIPFLLKKITKDCDVIHTHTYYPQLYSALTFNKKKLITTEHSTSNNRRKLIAFKFLDMIVYFFHKNIICISEPVKKSLLDWIPYLNNKKIEVIDNGISFRNIEKKDLNSNQLNLAEKYKDKVILVCVARLTDVKNHFRLIDSFKKSQCKNKDLILFIVGDGENKFKIKKYIESNNLKESIILLGDRNDVNELLFLSNIFILISEYEGFGLAALEAMVQKKPCILSNIEGLRNIVEDNDSIIYTNPKDHYQVSEAIDTMILKIKDEKTLNKNLDNTYKLIEKYNIENTVSKHEKLYFEFK